MYVRTHVLNQVGDTIVEVLVCIAVISGVLGTAYAIMNNSVQSNQSSQEHNNALKVAESQLEQLKSRIEADQTIPGSGANFCIYTNQSNQQTVITIPGTVPNTDFSTYPAECKFDQGDAADRFNTAISRQNNIFTVYVDWDGPKTKDSVSLIYKVY